MLSFRSSDSRRRVAARLMPTVSVDRTASTGTSTSSSSRATSVCWRDERRSGRAWLHTATPSPGTRSVSCFTAFVLSATASQAQPKINKTTFLGFNLILQNGVSMFMHFDIFSYFLFSVFFSETLLQKRRAGRTQTHGKHMAFQCSTDPR